jgi:hypothetical protein
LLFNIDYTSPNVGLINISEKIMSKSKSNQTPMTTKAVARIQSSEAKASGGQVSSKGFAARAARAAAINNKIG